MTHDGCKLGGLRGLEGAWEISNYPSFCSCCDCWRFLFAYPSLKTGNLMLKKKSFSNEYPILLILMMYVPSLHYLYVFQKSRNRCRSCDHLRGFLVAKSNSIRGFVRPWVRGSVGPWVHPSVRNPLTKNAITARKLKETSGKHQWNIRELIELHF